MRCLRKEGFLETKKEQKELPDYYDRIAAHCFSLFPAPAAVAGCD
jgi:hypothetical protein